MPTNSRKLKVEIDANVSGALRGFSKISNAGKSMARSIGGAFRGVASAATLMVAGISAATTGAFALAAQASNITEALNRVNVVFGDASGSVEAFSKESAESFGIGEAAALQYSAAFGQILTNTELGKEEIAEYSLRLVKMSGDLASFANLSTDEALQKVFSGLAGEIEPLRREGIAMDAAAVSAKALEMGLADVAAELTQGDKILARSIIMFEKADEAITGDFERTFEELAQQMKVAKAQFKDFTAHIGEHFVPVFKTAFTWFTTNLPKWEESIDASLGKAVETVTAIWLANGPQIKEIAGGILDFITARFQLMWGVFKAVLNWVNINWPTLKTIFTTVFDAIGDTVSWLTALFEESLIPTFEQIVQHVKDKWPEIKAAVVPVIEEIQATIETFIELVKTIWNKWGDEILETVTTVFIGIMQFVKGALGLTRGVITTITGLIEGDWGKFSAGLEISWGSVWGAIKGIARTQGNLLLALMYSIGEDGVREMAKGMAFAMPSLFVQFAQIAGLSDAFGATFDAIRGTRTSVDGSYVYDPNSPFSNTGGYDVIAKFAPRGSGSGPTNNIFIQTDPRTLLDDLQGALGFRGLGGSPSIGSMPRGSPGTYQ